MHQSLSKRSREPDRPDWADHFLVVQGGGKAPSDMGDAAGCRTWAERAAKIEADRQLWMQIEDLPLPNGETIAIRLSKDIKTVAALAGLDRFIAATGSPAESDDGTTTVSLGIHLQIVWRMISSLDQPQ